MADFGTILNPVNTSLNLFCNTLNAKTNLFIDGVAVGGSGNPNALINANPSLEVVANSMCIFDSENPTSCLSSNALTVDEMSNINIPNNLTVLGNVNATNITSMQEDINKIKQLLFNLTNITI